MVSIHMISSKWQNGFWFKNTELRIGFHVMLRTGNMSIVSQSGDLRRKRGRMSWAGDNRGWGRGLQRCGWVGLISGARAGLGLVVWSLGSWHPLGRGEASA